MIPLSNIQDAFQRFLLEGDAAIEGHVVGTEKVPVQTRLAIYGDGYRLRLIEALQSTFPVLASLLGETDFETLASRYIGTHASTFFSIRDYGHELEAFLAAETEYARAPVLPELARWEWAMAAIFDAADTASIATTDLAQIAPEEWAQLCFDWSPALRVVSLEWNVPQLWKAVTENAEPPSPDLLPQPGEWLLWRQDLQIYFRPLSPDEAHALAAAREGQSFGALCVLLCERMEDNEASRRAAGFLRAWVQAGLMTGVRTAAEEDE